MDQFVGILHSLANNTSKLDDLVGYSQLVRGKSDIITQFATMVIPSDRPNQNTTRLIQLLSEPRLVSSNPAFAVILLQLQSISLNDSSCVVSFAKICKTLVQHLTPRIAQHFVSEVASISVTLTRLACQSAIPAAVIRTLQCLIDLIIPSKQVLTSIHADLLQVCIKAHMYQYAVQFITDYDILEVNDTIDAEDYLRYFYYAGICYTAVQLYDLALASWQVVVTLPCKAVSAIMLAAYKKSLLLSAIHCHSHYTLPRHTSATLLHFLQEESLPRNTSSSTSSSSTPVVATTGVALYDRLVMACLAPQYATLRQCLADSATVSVLQAEGNLGLARKLLRTTKEVALLQCSLIYTSLPTSLLVSQATSLLQGGGAEGVAVSGGEVVSLLSQLVARQQLGVHLSEGEAEGEEVVHFEEVFRAEEAGGVEEVLDGVLVSQMASMQGLAGSVRALQKDLLTSSHYIRRTTSSSTSSLGQYRGGAGRGMNMNMNMETADLMDLY